MSNIIRKIKLLKALPLAYLLFTLSISAVDAQTPIKFIERSESEFLILGTNINGVTRSSGIEAYLPETSNPAEVLIPITAIANSLSYAIDVNSGDGIATGWIGDESNSFQLNLNSNEVIYNGDKETIPAGVAEAHIDDIYVQAQHLEKWFNLDISLDLSQLILDVSSKDALPFEEKKERAKKAEQLLSGQKIITVDTKNSKIIPYRTFSSPSLSIQENFTTIKTPGDASFQTLSSIQGNFDFLKLGTYFNLNYRTNTDGGNDITNSELTFQRRDPTNSLLGGLNAGRYEIGDITFPSTPLLIGQRRGAGFVASSDSKLGFRYANQGNNFLLEGEATVGWDAELYRNGHYVGFQVIESSGRFEFEDVELIDGYNLFEIVLYGPEGQKKTVQREVFRGANMLRPDETYYTIAAGLPQSDFIPLAENSVSDTSPGLSGEYLYGINSYLTLGGSLYVGPDDNDNLSASSFTAATALGKVNAQGRVLFANKGRKAYEALMRTRIKKTNLSASHTIYKGFDSSDQNIKAETGVAASRTFGRFSTTFSVNDSQFKDRADEVIFENITSTNIGNTKLTNTLTRVNSKPDSLDDFEGELAMQTNAFENVRLRGDITYDLDEQATDRLKGLTFTAQKILNEKQSFRWSTNYTVASDVIDTDVRYSHDIGPVAVDFNLGANTEDNYSFGIGLRTSLQPENDKDYKFLHPKRGDHATMGIRTFLDSNENNIFDDDENPIENIEIRASRGNIKETTNEEGITWLHGLVEMPTRFSIDLETVDSIDTVPSNDYVDVIPRRGANSVLDFPFKKLGEIDGFVFSSNEFDSNNNGISDAIIRLIDVENNEVITETSTESDGFYFLSALPLGAYRIVALPSVMSNEEQSINLELTLDDSNKMDINFTFDTMPIAIINTDIQDSSLAAISQTAVIAPPILKDPHSLHLGSLKSEQEARREAGRLETRYFDILDGIKLTIVHVQIGSGESYYRIIGGPIARDMAERVCHQIIVAKNPGGCSMFIKK